MVRFFSVHFTSIHKNLWPKTHPCQYLNRIYTTDLLQVGKRKLNTKRNTHWNRWWIDRFIFFFFDWIGWQTPSHKWRKLFLFSSLFFFFYFISIYFFPFQITYLMNVTRIATKRKPTLSIIMNIAQFRKFIRNSFRCCLAFRLLAVWFSQ